VRVAGEEEKTFSGKVLFLFPRTPISFFQTFSSIYFFALQKDKCLLV
jgi:hypothetical protein